MSKANEYVVLAGITLAAVVGVYWLTTRAARATVDTVGGVVSGNNAITQGTAYEGWGLFGTLGAATNSALGGVPSKIGDWLGGKTYDLTH